MITRRRMAVLGTALLAYALAWALLLANVTVGVTGSVDPSSTVTYAAVARLPSTGSWRYLADGSHVKSGYTTITCLSGGALELRYDPLVNVASVWVSPDETLTRRGIAAGASVGLTNTRILFTRMTADGPKPVPCSSYLLRGNSANVWVGLVGTPAGASN